MLEIEYNYKRIIQTNYELLEIGSETRDKPTHD